MNDTVDQLFYNAHDDSASRDFEYVRANIIEIIESQKQSLERLSHLAEAAQHARVYEVLGKFVETMVHSNEKLLDLQAKIRSLKDVSASINGPKSVTHNQTAIFVGTTAELQKHFKNVMKGEKNETTGTEQKVRKV